MAQMCVKSHRVDVAKVCLGNMGNVKGIKLLRDEIAKGADSDTQVAIIAINLGMLVIKFYFKTHKQVFFSFIRFIYIYLRMRRKNYCSLRKDTIY